MIKNMNKRWCFLFILILSLLYGCNSGAVSATVTVASTPIPLISTPTLPIAQTPILTLTTIPTPTTPEIVFLEDDVAFILDLIETSHDCKLPCILGIYPGQSTWQGFYDIYSSSKKIDELTTVEIGTRYFLSFKVDPESLINFDFTMIENEGVIKYLFLYASSLNSEHFYYNSNFSDSMTRYSLENVLTEFGTPSRLFVNIQEPAIGDIFNLLVYYDELGIGIIYFYEGSITRNHETDILLICPKQEFLAVEEFILKPANDDRSFESLSNSYPNELLHSPWEERTGLTLSMFYETVVNKINNGCFSVPVVALYKNN